MALTSQKISWCFRVMKENRNDITVPWDNSFYISIDCSGPYLQNVCWILCQIWKLHHGWWKILTLWYPDNWKMHLSVKYYYFPHTKLSPVPYPHPQVKTNYTHSPRHHFSENLSLSQKEGGEGNYAKKAIMKPYLGTILAIVFGTNILS